MLWWLAAPLYAQEAPIDLAAALDIALRDGVDAQEARFAADAAQSTLARRRQAGLPSLQAWARAGAELGADGVGGNASLGVSSSTTLYAGGTIQAARAAAEATFAAAEAERERVGQDLRYALASALLDLAAADAQVQAARATLAAEEAIQRRIQSAVEAGARTRADALQQSAAAARARSALVDAERSAALSRLALVEVLRLDSGHPWAFAPPTEGPAVDRGTDAELVEQAARARPELQAHRRRLDAADAARRAARGGGLPALALDLDASTGLAAGAGAPGTQLGDNAGASAVLSLQVPLYARGVVQDDVRQAELAWQSASLAWEAAREAVAVDVRSARIELRAGEASLEAARAREAASGAAVRVVNDRYEAGAAVLSELLTARADLADAERARIAAEVELVRSRFALAWAIGGL